MTAPAFNLAIDNHVLHCLIGDDRDRFLREVARVLRPGGVLFSDTMSREGAFDPARMGCDPATFVSVRGNRYWTWSASSTRRSQRPGSTSSRATRGAKNLARATD